MTYFNPSNTSRNYSNSTNNFDNLADTNDSEEKNHTDTKKQKTAQEAKDENGNRVVIIKTGAKIPVLKITAQSKDNPLSLHQVDITPATGNSPEIKLENLPVTPDSLGIQPISPRSPRSPNASRSLLEAQRSPRRLKVDGRIIGENLSTNISNLSPRPSPAAQSLMTTAPTATMTTTAAVAATTSTISNNANVPLTTTVTISEQKDQLLGTQFAHAQENVAYLQAPSDSSGLQQSSTMQYMRIRARISSRALAENSSSPISPRYHNDTKIKATTSDQIIATTRKKNAPCEKIVTDVVKMYSKAALENLKPGKADSIKTIGRMDPMIASAEMPETLKEFYIPTSMKSMPISPLLRNLYKTSFENTKCWKNALRMTKEALEKCNQKIDISDNDEVVKKSEKEKLQPLADAIVNALLPLAVDGETNPGDISARHLAESVLTKDFIKNVIFAVDNNVIEACKKDPELSIKEINDIRYFMLVDLIVTRMLAPMLGNLFPKSPNQSQIWLQSALLSSLKKVLPAIAKDFFDRSIKEMPPHLSSFLDQKARQEEENAAKERKKLYYQQFSELKEKSNSTRNLKNYQTLVNVRDRRIFNGKNKIGFEKLIEQLNLTKESSHSINFIKSQISQKLKAYTEEQTIEQIRFDLLSILHDSLTALSKTQNAISPKLTGAIQEISRQVASDTDTSVQKRTVAFNENAIYALNDQLIEELQAMLRDEEYIDFVMLETFHMHQQVADITTTVNTNTTTTTTTNTATNLIFSPSITEITKMDYQTNELNSSNSTQSSKEKTNS